MIYEATQGTLQVDSATEAYVLSHAIAIGRGSPDDRPHIAHHTYHETHDEVEFFNREMEAGKLTLRAALARDARLGLSKVATERTISKAISPHTAQTFLEVIDRTNVENKAGSDVALTSVLDPESAAKAAVPDDATINVIDMRDHQRKISQPSSPDLTAA